MYPSEKLVTMMRGIRGNCDLLFHATHGIFLSSKSLKSPFQGAIQLKISTCGVSKMDDFQKHNISWEVNIQVQYVDVHTCLCYPCKVLIIAGFIQTNLKSIVTIQPGWVNNYLKKRPLHFKKWRCSRRSNPLLIVGSLILHMKKSVIFSYVWWIIPRELQSLHHDFFSGNMGLKAIRGRRW